MKTMIKAVLAAGVLGLAGAPAMAQSERPYEFGAVWNITKVKTKDGRTSDYIRNLTDEYAKVMDQLVEEGVLLEYHILQTTAEDHDLLLIEKRPNWAALDRHDAFDDAIADVFGGDTESEGASVVRSELRTIKGSQLYQELLLKD